SEPNGPLSSLSSRISACRLMGLITESEKNDLNLIRRVRNKFAHQEHGLKFEDDPISSMCSSLISRRPPELIEYGNGYPSRARFTDSVIFNSLQLWYRPEHVSSFKPIDRKWPF